MAMTMMPRARSATRRPTPHYECRVVRTVVQEQPALSNPLRLLKENTQSFIHYKWKEPGKELGRLGVTLVMLEPVLRQILSANKRGAIRREDLTEFETELRERMNHAQFADQAIPLHDFSELALYGRYKQYLGIQLDRRDLRLIGDRAMVEQYIRDNYDRQDGSGVSKRFLTRNLVSMEPHITIGEVQYGNLTPQEGQQLRNDPTGFVVRRAYEQMEQNVEFGEEYGYAPIVFPETVALNGLRVFCQQK